VAVSPQARQVLKLVGVAPVVEGEAERQQPWDLPDRVFPEYADYREQAGKAGLAIPIFQLVPR
jgi:hypothetical protein